MNRLDEPRGADEGIDLYQEMEGLIRAHPWAWQSLGAVIGLAGGALSPFLGALLTAATWFIHSPRAISLLNSLSIVSFGLTIPLLAAGARCLDLLERKSSRISHPAESQSLTPGADSRPSVLALGDPVAAPRRVLTGSGRGSARTRRREVRR